MEVVIFFASTLANASLIVVESLSRELFSYAFAGNFIFVSFLWRFPIVLLLLYSCSSPRCGDHGILGDNKSTNRAVQLELSRMTGQTTVPQVYIGGLHIGGFRDVEELQDKGELQVLLASAAGRSPAV